MEMVDWRYWSGFVVFWCVYVWLYRLSFTMFVFLPIRYLFQFSFFSMLLTVFCGIIYLVVFYFAIYFLCIKLELLLSSRTKWNPSFLTAFLVAKQPN